jgi:hypothetical protein
MFAIFDLETNQLAKYGNGKIIMFEEGEKAKAFCKENIEKRYQPRVLLQENGWRERERKKIASGENFLPSYLSYFNLPDHFLHLSKEPPLLAYFKDEEKGRENKSTQIQLFTYLNKFWPNLPTEEVRRLESTHFREHPPKDGIFFAKTAEEIEHVYRFHNGTGGLNSCMTGEYPHLPCHPTAAYGNSDIEIAYMLDSQKRTSARCVVYPKGLLYGRGFGGNASTLLQGLKNRGYQCNSYYGGKFMVGARIRRILLPNHDQTFVLPYFDENTKLKKVDENFFEITPPLAGDQRWADTNGVVGPIHRQKLPMCQYCSLYQRNETDTPLKVVDGEKFCNYCYEQIFYTCAKTNIQYDIRKIRSVRMANGQTWSSIAVNSCGFLSDYDGNYYPNEEKALVRRPGGVVQFWPKKTAQSLAKLDTTLGYYRYGT